MNHDQHRMACFDIHDWQANFWHGPCLPCTTRSDNADAPDDGLPGFEVEMREAREEYVACKLLCETAYCVSICDRQYQEKVQDIYDRYGKS